MKCNINVSCFSVKLYNPYVCLSTLQIVAPDDKYEVKRCLEEAAIIVSSVTEPKIKVTVTLTSPVMRENSEENIDKAEASGGMPLVNGFTSVLILIFKLFWSELVF